MTAQSKGQAYPFHFVNFHFCFIFVKKLNKIIMKNIFEIRATKKIIFSNSRYACEDFFKSCICKL